MKTGRLIGIAATAAVAAVAALAWTFLAPVQLGGGTSYAVVVGSSMEPSLHRGDLAVVRRRSSYRAGDVVLYDSRQLGTKVLHRIVRVEDGRFVLQGDNNDFLDPERPTQEQIAGTLWVSAPAVGRVTEWLRQPLHSALAIGFVTLIALGGAAGAGAGFRRGPRPAGRTAAGRPSPVANRLPSPAAQPLIASVAVAAVAALALGVVSFARPLTTTAEVDGAYAHQGRFDYEATVARNAAYPTGRLETGDPVFLRLVPRLRVSFGYGLESGRPADVAGRIALDARISDGRGWERTLPVATERSFEGRSATASGVLDLRRIERIVEDVRVLTGSAQTVFTVTLLPRVEVEGSAGADRIDATFAPALTFDYGDLRLQPKLDAGEGVGPLAPRESAAGMRAVAAELALGPFSLAVGTARRLSLLAVALLLLLGGAALALWRRRDEPDEHAAIASRYAHLLVPVASLPRVADATEVSGFDALVRVAEHHGRLILHGEDGHGRAYVVEEGGVAYCYRPARPVRAETPGAAEAGGVPRLADRRPHAGSR